MENKRVTHTARLFLRLWNVGWFAYIWFSYYNRYTFDTYKLRGGLATVALFFVGYTLLCHAYKAFRIASSDVVEIVFSQFVSFAIPDFILYLESILIYNQFISFWPGLAIVGIQLAGTMVISLSSKRYFMRHVSPQKTILVYGKAKTLDDARAFEKRLMFKYKHLFSILYIEHESLDEETFQQRLQGCSTLIMYALTSDRRSAFTKMCLESKKNFYYTPGLTNILDMGCEPKHLLDTPLMKYEYGYENNRTAAIKRVLDIFFALLLIIITSPIMLISAIAIKAEDHGPVFFKQKRYTKNAKVFEIIKFRSMIVDAEKYGAQPSTENDPRVTKVGKFMRSTRIDELPQLFNILSGDMSFVGPRPERVEHVDEYSREIPEFRYRLVVKGGLTGYAQVYGKYNTSPYDKMLLDLMYIENQSLLLDARLVLMTARLLLKKDSTEGFDKETSRDMQRKIVEREEELKGRLSEPDVTQDEEGEKITNTVNNGQEV